jgi:hypothetical protein
LRATTIVDRLMRMAPTAGDRSSPAQASTPAELFDADHHPDRFAVGRGVLPVDEIFDRALVLAQGAERIREMGVGVS